MSSSVQRFRELQHHISKNCAIPVFVRIRNMRSSVSFRGRVTSSSTRPRYKVESPSNLMTFGDLEKADAPLVQAPWRDRGQQHRYSLPRGRCSCGGRSILMWLFSFEYFDKQGDGTNFGLWSDYVLCPDDTAVCGIKTKVFIPSFKIMSTISKEVIQFSRDPFNFFQVEASQGASDDTALNQIKLYCCTL